MGVLTDLGAATRGAAERPGLSALFAPRSIAFIGASERVNAPASRGLRHCLRLGFDGPIHAVNPKHESLFGVRCVPSVAALPEPVDLAVIALLADATLEAVAACARHGVRAVVICSSGWGEAGDEGRARDRRLRELVRSSQLRVLGPNCIGVGAASARFCVAYNSSFEHIAFRHRRPIGVACQSGAMLGGLLLNAEDAGIGVEAFAHVGNGADVSLEEAGAFLLEQPNIRTLALMIEGLSDAAAFVALARRARVLDKRIAVFKAGSSDAGSRAVRSHTGALAGSDEIFSAVCDDEGIVRVREPEDLLPVARVLNRGHAPAGRRVLVFSLSGGGASVLADELSAAGLSLPELSPATRQRCDALGNPFIRTANPMDVGGSVFSDPDAAREALSIAVQDAEVDAVCWIGVGAPRDERSNLLLGAALDVLSRCDKPAFVVPMSGTPVEPGFERAHALDIPVTRSVKSAALLAWAALLDSLALPASPAAASRRAPAHAAAVGRVIAETAARAELGAHGIPVLASHFVADAEALGDLAARLGFPLVLKGIVRGVAHKTEAGLVEVGITDAPKAVEAARRMRLRNPEIAFDGFTLERQLVGGVETVVGARVDPQFGPMLMFGLGGVAVELFGDVAFTACPCTPQRARELIDRTRAGRLLAGFRGRPAADRDALVDAMVALSNYAAGHAADIVEVEVNPLIVLPEGQGAHAVDALIVRRH